MRIVVVGDVLLDVDVAGAADRLSPDAPVPVVSVSETLARPGGAGLVASLIARDGADVTLVTALGDDDGAARLRALLTGGPGHPGAGRVEVVAGASRAPTPTKTRVRASGHAMIRIDEGDAAAPAPDVTDRMIAALDDADAIVVADYGRGITSDARLRDVLQRAGERVPVVWDPHPRGASPVPSVALVTPNSAEAAALVSTAVDDIPAAAEAGERLRSRWDVDAVLVTLGDRGALLARRGSTAPHVVPAVAVAAPDTCGAGDRLAAAVALALAGGDSLVEACVAGVSAAGRFLAAGGVAGLAVPGNTRPLGGAADALTIAAATRAAGGTVVATGGCFDLLHAGHARTLAAARALGDCLVVCLNSDDSVRRLKGPERPIMGEQDRRDLLLALECVDAVVVFAESTPEAVLRRVRPDIWVKGGDYAADDLPETAVIAEWGGRTVTVPYHPGRSTTGLAGALARVG
ncbi:PfkB family carbohydrate kinase [Microbacterium sp. LRZ72]|uniref:PfkB family carbohydrate kinase n=1 Tax=Microbacterium sp. LRZ72 TaxID=2942481 RepID=UPI0029BC5863|nr:PfkB family carbohydrate kinase [Microbacterium sp. LRZ72]MDX2376732.1 PfkB family carbohydrate kinase [Microbacterium sp. LRZ72]